MKKPIIIKYAETDDELRQVLALQAANLKDHVPATRQKADGFVTVRHDLALLKKMNTAAGQVIAKDGDTVVGYALVMLNELSTLVPVLVPMFELFNTLSFRNRPVSSYRYYVMGQVCVAETHRGQGVFAKLYEGHKNFYASRFDLCLTEISSSNLRSMRAHEKIGFQTIHSFRDETDHWNVVLWDWQEK